MFGGVACSYAMTACDTGTAASIWCGFSSNGLPDAIVSDNTTSFTAVELKDSLPTTMVYSI